MKELLTVKQAAEVLGVSVDTMRELVWSKRIDYVDINKGGKYIIARFSQKHIDDFLKRNEVLAG